MYWVQGAHPKVGQFQTTLISLHNPDILATLSNFRESHILCLNFTIIIFKYLAWTGHMPTSTKSHQMNIYNWVVGFLPDKALVMVILIENSL